MTHVFEQVGDEVSASSGPRVPTWSQVNQAKDMLCNHGAAGFEQLKTAWRHQSIQVWNPVVKVQTDQPPASMEKIDKGHTN